MRSYNKTRLRMIEQRKAVNVKLERRRVRSFSDHVARAAEGFNLARQLYGGASLNLKNKAHRALYFLLYNDEMLAAFAKAFEVPKKYLQDPRVNLAKEVGA